MGGQEGSRGRCGASTLRSGSAAAAEDGSSRLPDAPGGSPARPARRLRKGFRTASPAARDAPHHHATRSLPKTLRSRLHESFLWIIGISLAKSKCFETWQKRAAGSGSTKLQIQTEALSDVYFGRGQTIRKDQTKDNRITAFATLQISRPK
jgi:hypothetical protein